MSTVASLSEFPGQTEAGTPSAAPAIGRAGGATNGLPVCVDLDGTLVKTDTLHECLILLLKVRPWLVLLLPFWMLRGKAFFKRQVCSRVDLDVATLPYHVQLVNHLRQLVQDGRAIYLVTGADACVARKVAAHIGGFAGVICSDGTANLTGSRKCDHLVDRFGEGGFVYAGNGAVDVAVWRKSAAAMVVNASAGVASRAGAVSRIEATFDDRPQLLRSISRAVRSHQWVKNVLLFVPLITSHRLTDVGLLVKAALAYVSYSLCASSVYLVNDLLDLQADRRHEKNRHRPFASGNLPLAFGPVLAAVLLVSAFGICLFLPPLFAVSLAAYFVITLSYSMYFKRKLLVDVMFLGGLYTMRVLAGNAATGVAYSAWLLAFSMFLFVSLAFAKRYASLCRLRGAETQEMIGRGYLAVDKAIVANLGCASGFICVLVLALYINSPQVQPLYATPIGLWLLCPLLMYWVGRFWVIAGRERLDTDPVLFALQDRVSYFVGACAAAVIFIATLRWPIG